MGGAELALAIAKASKLRGEFRLRSGAVTTEYFDKYRFEADPALLRAITDSLVTLVPSATDALAGLELGGVPLATALTLRTGLPAIFVRKRPKEYGTCRLAEGGDIAVSRCVRDRSFVGFVGYPEHCPGDGLGTVVGDGAGVYLSRGILCLGQQTTRIFGPHPVSLVKRVR